MATRANRRTIPRQGDKIDYYGQGFGCIIGWTTYGEQVAIGWPAEADGVKYQQVDVESIELLKWNPSRQCWIWTDDTNPELLTDIAIMEQMKERST